MKFILLFEKFAKCNSGMSHAKSNEELIELESDISVLITYLILKFPQSTFTPKLHILWRHVVDFIRKTGVSLGIMGEQGGESIHASFNKVSRRLKGIMNTRKSSPELELLKATFEEHLVLVHPSNRNFLSSDCTEE